MSQLTCYTLPSYLLKFFQFVIIAISQWAIQGQYYMAEFGAIGSKRHYLREGYVIWTGQEP